MAHYKEITCTVACNKLKRKIPYLWDLIAELSQITYVNIATTITSMDETIRQKLELGGVKSLQRFAMLKEFAKTNTVIFIWIKYCY